MLYSARKLPMFAPASLAAAMDSDCRSCGDTSAEFWEFVMGNDGNLRIECVCKRCEAVDRGVYG